MAEHMEIERKYLVKMPDIGSLNVTRKRHIIQTYLTDGKGGSQRRVRKIEENGRVEYTYTEKIFLTRITRRENEYEINADDYERLCRYPKKGLVPVEKTRYCFEYENQMFELDVYPYSDELAILELELKDSAQEIFFPEYIEVIEEVSEKIEYSNANLARAGKFPDMIGDNE